MNFKNILTFDPAIASDFIKDHEGLRLEAYQCPAGIWTIGYGHTGGVKKGDKITKAEAENLLREDLNRFQDELFALVKVPLTQGMFIALMSFLFNFGLAKCRGYTLFKELNKANYWTASEWFGKYIYAGNKIHAGLVKRRSQEQNYFRNEIPTQ